MMTEKRVLDPCCGSRMMWFDRAHPDVVFGDKRSETITVTDRSHGNASGQRVLRVEPDVLLDFRAGRRWRRTCKKNLWPDCANGQAQSARPNLP